MRHRLVPFRRVLVEGTSMRPGLEPGDRLVLLPVLRPRRGDLVGVVDPRDRSRLMVKRVTAVETDGYVVSGDNAARSTDSRHFGLVPADALRGRAVFRYAPARRRGRLYGRRPSARMGPWRSSTRPGSSRI